ncbi:MAG: glucose-6-phosphate isomerase [Spirochaetales bacterium]|nr:glucose-6-phosphate isomerase [Spirochaetales bacterium]
MSINDSVAKIRWQFPFSLQDEILQEARRAQSSLESRSCPGQEFLGWLDLPAKMKAEHSALQSLLIDSSGVDALVVVGIGGSYLGTRAALEALRPPFTRGLPVYFAGHHLDSAYHAALMKFLDGKKYLVHVISKSGTTTEPGIAFRLLYDDLRRRFPDSYRELILAVTDEKKGALRQLAQKEGLKTCVIPDDVGGRYSVFSYVGLLPLAQAGLDTGRMLEGALAMQSRILAGKDNPALEYAAYRNQAYRSGKKIEILASYRSSLTYFAEWWKQLFGESEGKEGRSIFPASVNLTTDLHSMGQWIQDGERTIFETVLDVQEETVLRIPSLDMSDGLGYLEGKSLAHVNRAALEGTRQAHSEGGVPVAVLSAPEMTAEVLGALFYLFEYACGISALMLGVNPFDQPGVEAYKKSMFRLLGKPE